ncbi:MAG TPA: DUF1499 domain-containing protein [Candidatus Binataceae bacterium]
MGTPQILIVAAIVAVVLLLIFVRILRFIVMLVLRLAIFFAAVFVAVGGLALLMNNETIFEKPGWKPRVIRFLTVKSAATSEKGLGSATCVWGDERQQNVQAQAPPTESGGSHRHNKNGGKGKPEKEPAAAETTTGAVSTKSSTSSEEDVYPELIRAGYPGIPRQKLFELAQATVNSLGGWKIVKADPRSFSLDCTYTSRILGLVDDVRITVMPNAEVDICSRSEAGTPDSSSLMRFFPGDLGANLAHIKQFSEALEPKMDEVYKEQQDQENAKKPRP